MKKIQKFLDQFLPDQYVITDQWSEKDSSPDHEEMYAVYLIPQYLRTLGHPEILQKLKLYSPEFVIYRLNNVRNDWCFDYTVTWPGDRDTPPDSEYKTFHYVMNSAQETVLEIIIHIIKQTWNAHFDYEEEL